MPKLYLKEIEPFIVTHKKGKVVSRDVTNDTQNHAGQQKLYSRQATKRNTSLVATDALLLCLELLQVLAVMQAMSLKWIWPETWIRKTNFIFFFTADVWEFIKVDCGAFIGVRNYDTPSATVSTKFYYILVGWGASFSLVAIVWGIIKIVLHRRQSSYLLMHNAKLVRALTIIAQIVALPFGVTAFKVFQCTSSGLLSVDNSVECWAGYHWAYVVPVVVSVVALYVAFPAWLFWRIHHESMASADQHHDDFLKLKEVEYMSGLDMVWAVKGLYLFSSFHLRAIYFRPVAHLVKLLLLVIFAASFQNTAGQAISFAVVFLLVALVMMCLRPFRLMLFNVVMTLGYFCLMGSAVFGAIITNVGPTEVESPWLVEPYSIYILVALNGVILFAIIVVFLIYLLAYRHCCQGKCVLESMWPVMTVYDYDVEGFETQKYLGAVLRARALIEKCRRLPALFVPVHEIVHQICILNAYMRESELLHDGLHPTLWAVLDELIDMHRRLEPRSLFGEMVHESIRKNAAHFMTLMPMFAQRLAQRDYDLILVSPLKKRLLMKMYIIAMFLDGSQCRRAHQELTQKVLTRIWEESPEIVVVSDEREYHEELYPPPAEGPDTEALYSMSTLDLGHGLYDLEAVEDEEESLASFLKRAPPQLTLLDDEPDQENLEEEYKEDEEEKSDLTGEDNPAFVPDGDNQQGSQSNLQGNKILTTVDVHDDLEVARDVLVDLEAPKSQDEGESIVELDGYQAGESSTDGAIDGSGLLETRRGRSDTDTSMTSTQSHTSEVSANEKSLTSEASSNSADISASALKSRKAVSSVKSTTHGKSAVKSRPAKKSVGKKAGGKGK